MSFVDVLRTNMSRLLLVGFFFLVFVFCVFFSSPDQDRCWRSSRGEYKRKDKGEGRAAAAVKRVSKKKKRGEERRERLRSGHVLSPSSCRSAFSNALL